MTSTPRPQWNHPDVKTAAAKRVIAEVRAWALAAHVIDADASMDEFTAVTTLAIIENPDAYQASRYMETFLGWPSDGNLTRVFDAAYREMPRLTTPVVREWVVKTGTRFPAQKGQDIRFRVGDATVTGRVLEVLKAEARAFVEVQGAKRNLCVFAEDVIKVNKTVAPNHTGPNNGGTPVAAQVAKVA